MISPNGSTPTSPTMPGCWGWRGRRAATGCIATATAIAALPKQRPIESGLCGGGAGCAAVHADPACRGSCWPGRPAGSAPPRCCGWAPRRSACWSRSRNCCGSCGTGWARCAPVGASPDVAGHGLPGRWPTPGGGHTTWSICRRISWMRRRPTRRRSRRRRSSSYLRVLAPDGMVSIPVSIRDFPVYALRMLATVRAALLAAGVDDPAAHVIVYRSAWNVRILVSRDGWSAATDRGGPQVLRRPVVRHVLVSRHGRGEGAGWHLQRPAGGVVRQGRGRSRRAGRRDRR